MTVHLLKIKQNIDQGRIVGLIWPWAPVWCWLPTPLTGNTGQVSHPVQVAWGSLSHILCPAVRIMISSQKSKEIPVLHEKPISGFTRFVFPWFWHLPGKWIVRPFWITLVQLNCISLIGPAANDCQQKQCVYGEVWTMSYLHRWNNLCGSLQSTE